eukprot:TRINITY_DN530_c4_g1_i1.p1 TRINITY_DN530_c4_g1~~TRINITY_DN530_c4_g1_i1.p1  ORF type:complete len:420 (+),score=190.39 TRINITY_DN530_c4_g1_i1:55-1260(+)
MAETAAVPAGSYFDFTVGEHKKEKGGALDLSYWTYQIQTRTTLVGEGMFKAGACVAVRRYNDFVWLREALVEENPGVICPPIPEKSIKGMVDKMAGSDRSPVREYRQRAMRKFLVRVGAHPILHTSPCFIGFLELDTDAAFDKLKKEPRAKKEIELTGGEKMTQVKSSLFSSKSKAVEEGSWDDAKQYVAQLEASLSMLKDRIDLLTRRRRDTGASLNEFGKAFSKVGDIERNYEEGPISQALSDVGRHSEHLSGVYGEQAESETIQVTETIMYYIGMCQAVRDVLKRLSRMAFATDTLEQSVFNLKVEKKNAEDAGKTTTRIQEMEQSITACQARHAEAQKLQQAAADIFSDELRRFQREKQYDIKSMLRSFVELQLEYANKMKKSWETLLPSVEAIKAE